MYTLTTHKNECVHAISKIQDTTCSTVIFMFVKLDFCTITEIEMISILPGSVLKRQDIIFRKTLDILLEYRS